MERKRETNVKKSKIGGVGGGLKLNVVWLESRRAQQLKANRVFNIFGTARVLFPKNNTIIFPAYEVTEGHGIKASLGSFST
jgi:hypothetical protein